MVNKAAVTTHSVAVNHEAAIQVKAIVVRVTEVGRGHAFFEHLVRHHFADIFQNKLAILDWQLCANTPTLKRNNILHVVHQIIETRKLRVPLYIIFVTFELSLLYLTN